MSLYTVRGTYGSDEWPTSCDIFVLETNHGSWYAVEGSENINFTPFSIGSGVNVECLTDTDGFSGGPIDSEEALRKEVAEYLDDEDI